MGDGISPPCSRQPANCSYPEPDESTPISHPATRKPISRLSSPLR
jgi:hypothetical protein